MKNRTLLEGLEKRILLDTVTETVTVGPLPPSTPATTFTVNKFDDQGGTRRLLSVRLDIVLQSTGGGTGLENEGPGTGSATVTIGTDVDVERDSENHGDATWDLQLSATESQSRAVVAPDSDAAPDYLYPNDDDSVVVIGTTSSDQDSKTWTNTADLLAFIGSGQIAFYYDSDPNNSSVHTIGGGIVNTVTVQAAQFLLTVTIVYTFDQPVLEVTKGVIATDGPGSFTRPAGPVAFTAPGSAGVRFSGTIGSADLDLTTVDADMAWSKPTDLVSFGIVVENVGGGSNGAYDVRLRDTLPQGFSIPAGGLNLTVTDGTGAAIAYTTIGTGLFDPAGGIELTDPGPTAGAGAAGALDPSDAAAGRNLVVLTYDLEIDHNVFLFPHPTVYRELVNTVTVYNYAGLEGGTDLSVTDLRDPARVTLMRYGGDDGGDDDWSGLGPWRPQEQFQTRVLQPMYSGTAQPGSTLSVDLYNARGELIGSRDTVVDAGGNWAASLYDVAMADQPHSVVLRQSYTGYTPLAQAGFNLRPYYSPAFQGGTYVSEALTVENVVGKRSLAGFHDMFAAAAHPLSLSWPTYNYEMLAVSGVPSAV